MSSPLRRLQSLDALTVVAGLLLACLCVVSPAKAADSNGIEILIQAERQVDAGPWLPVVLPDWPVDSVIDVRSGVVRYRIEVANKHAGSRGMRMEGMLANGVIGFNGHRLREAVDPQARNLPRGLDRMALLSLPQGLWLPGSNVIEIEARAQPRMSISRIEIGDFSELKDRHDSFVLTHYISPLLAGAVVGTLGLAMLALWFRLRDPSSLLFATGALAWWLVNWMPLFAWPRVGGVGYAIAWTCLHGVVVAAFAAFCLRQSDWYRPRLEQLTVALALAGPVLLAAGHVLKLLDLASTVWRLLLIAGVCIALGAVVRAYWHTRSKTSLAMVLCGAIALVLGAYDWVADLDSTSNYPLALSTYTGLAFAAVAAAILVERYVDAARSSAHLRNRLEERVQEQGAQLRQALKEMEAARDAACAADLAKSSFLAVASHDLRQPAHAIGLYVAAMPTEGLNAEQTDVLKRLQQSHSALERMFDALLDMSQIDAGTLAPQRRTVEPWTLMQRLADEAAPAAESKGLRLALRAGSGTADLKIHTDPILVERMLRNLIGNAIKYTQHGGVLLACRVRSQGDVRRMRMEVWDTGPGVEAEHRERVFDEFYRVSTSRRSGDGLGLGLPIVRRLARMLDVDVGLSSQPGHGSCFHLSFNLGPTSSPWASPPSVVETPSLEGLSVGVLEDDATVRDALSRTLRRWGCRVASAASAQELLDGGPPEQRSLDLLIVDYGLAGGLTGPEQALQYASAAAARPRVLVVTGEQTPERLQQFSRLELTWLPKPVSASVLKATIAGLVAPRPANSGD